MGAIIQTIVAAFVIGVLARWAVPGPDPMPVWLTIAFGLVGSLIGSGIAVTAFGSGLDSGTAFSAWLFSILAASLMVMAYRRFIQKRPITGPGAHRPPPGERPSRLKDVFGSPAKRAYEREDVSEQLRKLGELHREGVISDDDFERKKAELLARM